MRLSFFRLRLVKIQGIGLRTVDTYVGRKGAVVHEVIEAVVDSDLQVRPLGERLKAPETYGEE